MRETEYAVLGLELLGLECVPANGLLPSHVPSLMLAFF